MESRKYTIFVQELCCTAYVKLVASFSIQFCLLCLSSRSVRTVFCEEPLLTSAAMCVLRFVSFYSLPFADRFSLFSRFKFEGCTCSLNNKKAW